MKSPRRDRRRRRQTITRLTLLGAISVLLVVMAPLDVVSDRIAVAQAAGEPGVHGAAAEPGTDVDTRLVLQIGMLFAALYVALVCVWLSRTRGAWRVRDAVIRVRSMWHVAVSNTRARLIGNRARTVADGPAVCSIAWKPGHHRSRFQAVMRLPGERRQRVVAESAGLPWPPKDSKNPPTRELEAALTSLVAQMVAAGWEPMQSDGSWTERRFVWRASNLVALDGAEAAAVPIERRVAAQRLPRAAAAAVVAIVGLALAAAPERDERAAAQRATPGGSTIVHDGLRVRLPKGWTVADAAAVPGFSRPLELGNPRARVSAVVERLRATSASLLPGALERADAAGGARPARVGLAAGQAGWRYRLARSDGSSRVVVAAPTTAGVTTVVCTSPAAAGATRSCQALASAIRTLRSHPLNPDGSAAFLSRLPGVVTTLERARGGGMRELASARRPSGQAAAARILARAHTAAAATLAPLARAAGPAPARTVAALSTTAEAYATLGSAARAGAGRRYAAASHEVLTADTKLRRALVAAVRSSAPRVAPPPSGGDRPRTGGWDLTLPLLGLAIALGILFGTLSLAREARRIR